MNPSLNEIGRAAIQVQREWRARHKCSALTYCVRTSVHQEGTKKYTIAKRVLGQRKCTGCIFLREVVEQRRRNDFKDELRRVV